MPCTMIEARMKAYKNAAQCLSDFEQTFLNRTTMGIALVINTSATWLALRGEHWQSHEEWEGHRHDARQVRRKDRQIFVADGVVFPVLAALSNFVRKAKRRVIGS